MPREVARVSATAIIWTAIAMIFGFLLLGKTAGPFEMVLGILIAVCGLVSTAAVWEQLNDSSVHLHLSEEEPAASSTQKRKTPIDEEQIRRLVDSLDHDTAGALFTALQERDGNDGEFLSLRHLMEEESRS
ncbi:MAG: hypothetical protein OXF83_02735 [Anaerolineaceae bacterium]|nr:hypothetical protein [Anaerolineaceae bacterium]MCY3935791.1 hypothetical protein [Chloroflexota bacterium]